MRALGNNIIVEPINVTISKGMIVMPQSYQPDDVLFRVVAVGPGRRNPKTGERVPIGIAPGQRVLSRAINAERFEFEGRLYRILNADQVLMIFPDERSVQVEA